MRNTYSLSIRIICASFLVLHFHVSIQAQSLGDQLRSQLEGKSTLSEIMTEVEKMYGNLTDEQRKKGYDGLMKMKHWKRWEWYTSRHLGAEGELVNIAKHNFDLIKEIGKPGMPSTRSVIQGSWTSLGPVQTSDTLEPAYHIGAGIGRVDRIAFDPVDEDIIYAGTPNGGLWKTFDGGESWEPLLDTFASLGVSGITVNQLNPDEIYILTGVADQQVNNWYHYNGMANSIGVFRSLDGGESWEYTSDFPLPFGAPFVGYDLEQSEIYPDIILAATSYGIFKTEDSGEHWELVLLGHYYDVEFKPGSVSTIYAAGINYISYTENGGVNWFDSHLDLWPAAFSDRIALGVSPANPSIVYAFFGNNDGQPNLFSGFYMSEDEGKHFTRKAITPNVLGGTIEGDDDYSQARYDLCIAVHPDEINRVIIGATNVWHSTNSGNSFSYLKGFVDDIDSIFIHADQHAVAYNPLNNKLYICNDGGIWVSSNNGTSVTNITDGLVLTQFFHLAQDYSENYRLACGAQDNGTMVRINGSTHFLKVTGGDGYDMAFVAGNPDKVYASVNNSMTRINLNTGFVTHIAPELNLWFKEIVSHPTDSNIVFCAGVNTIYRSTNQGDTWTNVGGKGSWAMTISPSNPSYMYAAGCGDWWQDGSGGAYRSQDGGITWTLMSNNPGFPSITGTITGISVYPYNPLYVYVTKGGFSPGEKVFFSSNGGLNFFNISHNLPNVAVLSIVTTPDGIFIGTDISVYYLAHGDNVWIDIGSNIPHAGITDLAYNPNSGTLIASTFGRGVWQRNVCVEDINLTYPLTGELTYSCNDQLLSSSFIPGEEIDSINFRAYGSIKMTPGFNVKTGAHLKAKIESCDDGNIPFQGLPPENKVSMTNQPAGLSEKKSNQE